MTRLPRLALAVSALALMAALSGCGGGGGSAAGTPESTAAGTAESMSTESTTGGALTTPGLTVTVPGVGAVTIPQGSVANPGAKGREVFSSAGCSGCHTFKAAGASGTVGPNLDTRVAADAKKAGQPVPVFVATSIVAPNTYVAPAYSKDVMPANYKDTLSPTELASLVAFVSADAG